MVDSWVTQGFQTGKPSSAVNSLYVTGVVNKAWAWLTTISKVFMIIVDVQDTDPFIRG